MKFGIDTEKKILYLPEGFEVRDIEKVDSELSNIPISDYKIERFLECNDLLVPSIPIVPFPLPNYDPNDWVITCSM